MSKEVVAKAKSEVSTEVASLSEWGAPQPLGQDIVLSKILPMQGMSKLVMDGKAQFGEFRDSVTGEKMGSIVEPLVLLPFHVEKFWDVQQPNEKGDFKWVRTEPLIENPADPKYNDNLPWMDKEKLADGSMVETKRIRRMNFYVLRPSEIEAGTSIPYILSFKSTSFKEGKKLYSQMYMRNRRANLPPPGYLIVLGGRKDKNDDGTWVVPEYELGPKASAEQIQEALNWFKLIQKGNVKVDDSDLQDVEQMSFSEEDAAGTGNF